MSSETAIVEASARQIVPSELMGSGQAAVKTFKAIIDKSTVEIQGKGGQVSKHLRVEGWTSIAQGMGAEIRVPTIEMQRDGSVEAIAIVSFGLIMDGYVLSPRLVGASVGLHPVWIMFALLAFGALFGFTGMIIAVPTAAALGAIMRFLAARYRRSALYRESGHVSHGT